MTEELQSQLSRGRVPAERIVEEVNRALGLTWPWSFKEDDPSPLSSLTKYWDGDDLRKMLRDGDRWKWIEFDLADRILCSAGLPHLWWGQLSDIYYGVDLSKIKSSRVRNAEIGKRRCARPGCTKQFVPHPRAPKSGPKMQRYCSASCCQMARAYRIGLRPRPSESPQKRRDGTGGYVCRNGHERTKENTRITKDGRRVCRICCRERARFHYHRNRETILARRRARRGGNELGKGA